ncbi:alpha/beta fold hydrolase [Roseomonas sp. BN140053]|uniref:alpha/beta fold hydrolase n=1 Tax=Roseomonas sp. BN140053 TaxID=3391898 RepID=UPI0039E8B930
MPLQAAATAEGAVQLRGTGEGPPVLLLGAPASVAPLAAALEPRFRVLQTDAAEPAPADIAAALAEAGAERLGIVAAGREAVTALRLALQLGEAVESLVLLSPGLPGDTGLGEQLNTLAAPVLCLFGTREENGPPLRAWRQAVPVCHVVLVFDATAAMAAERPEAVASVAGDFLRRRDQFIVSGQPARLHP